MRREEAIVSPGKEGILVLYLFLFVGLTTLGTFIEFAWLVIKLGV